MKRVSIEEAQARFRELFDYVNRERRAIMIEQNGLAVVKIIPVPQPVGEFKGRPMYSLKELQFLNAPWWFD